MEASAMSTDGSRPAPPTQIVIQERSSAFGRYGKWLALALVAAIIAIISLYGRYQSYFSPADAPQEKYHSLAQYAPKKIAIINVEGTIWDVENGFAKKQIDRVAEDNDVVAVVLRINSPGGTITGSDYLYHHLQELKTKRELPIVVSMGSLCASGGYYIAMAVGNEQNAIFAEPATWTGSIGVIIPHFDLSMGLRVLGIQDDSIVSGPYKELGSITKPLQPDERKILQTLVDGSFKDFKDVVISGRPKFKDDPAALDAVATGQIFTAKQALENGLIDKIGFIEDAIARATELAGYNAGDVRCVKYEQAPSLMGALLGSKSTAAVPVRGEAELARMIDFAAPRAYYLWTWLPTLMSNSR
jgi:protease IV